MKNSGIEWIGEIPDNWGVKRVKDVFSITGGCGFKDEFQGRLDGDYPFCKASDINGKDKFLDHAQNYVNQDIVDEQHYKVVPKYSILMSKIGEAMKKNHRKINTIPCIVDNNCQALCKKSNDDIIYLYYLFSQIDMIWFDNGGTIPNISNTKLLNFFIPDINVDLQKRIAYHLDEKCGKIDELIENQQTQIEKLKEYKQSVITEAVTKGLDKSAPLKDSGIEWIGEIPESWGVKRVKDVFSITGGCGFKDEFQGRFEGDYPFCKASDINGQDKFLDSAQNYVNQDIVDEQHYKVVPKYSILMSKIGEAMKKNHRKINTIPCIVDNNCQALCKKSNDDIIYLYYLLSQIDMIWFDNGGTIPNISNTKLLNFFIPDISVELQKQIVDYLDEKCGKIDRLIAIKQEKIEKLQEYKKSLIYEYVTGKKEVV